ncbi:MAG: DUF4279 domain-containing protein [Pseudomonadota bacterium]
MPQLQKSSVSLCFVGDALDPDEITTRLGLALAKSYRKGETWRTPNGTPMPARSGMWRGAAETASPSDLDGRIARLLALATQDLAAWKDLSSRFHGELCCGLWVFKDGSGFDRILPPTLSRIAERGLHLVLEIYVSDEPDPDEQEWRWVEGPEPLGLRMPDDDGSETA